MSRTQIHTDVVQRLKEAGYEMDVDGNFIYVREEKEEMDNRKDGPVNFLTGKPLSKGARKFGAAVAKSLGASDEEVNEFFALEEEDTMSKLDAKLAKMKEIRDTYYSKDAKKEILKGYPNYQVDDNGEIVINPQDPNWYEELLNKRELEELAKHNKEEVKPPKGMILEDNDSYLERMAQHHERVKEVNTMNKSEKVAATIGKSIAKTELWTRSTGIPNAKKAAKATGKATVKAGKALRRFGKGMAAGYKAAKE